MRAFATFVILIGTLRPAMVRADEPPGLAVQNESLTCLTAAIYYEAAREPLDGQRAVARVVLNRLADPAFPKSVCGVIYQGSTRTTGCQFTFTCDGSLFRRSDPQLWQQAAEVAAAALAHPEALPDLGALHYHATYVRPGWAAALREETRIGHHIFYAAGHAAAAPKPATGGVKPAAATFSAWGLPIARVTPDAAGDVSIDPTAADPG